MTMTLILLIIVTGYYLFPGETVTLIDEDEQLLKTSANIFNCTSCSAYNHKTYKQCHNCGTSFIWSLFPTSVNGHAVTADQRTWAFTQNAGVVENQNDEKTDSTNTIPTILHLLSMVRHYRYCYLSSR